MTTTQLQSVRLPNGTVHLIDNLNRNRTLCGVRDVQWLQPGAERATCKRCRKTGNLYPGGQPS